MKTIKSSIIVILSLFLWSTEQALAQENNSLTSKQTSIVIDTIGNILASNYIFPETAAKMVAKMKKGLKTKSYSSIEDPQEFAQKLTEELRAISHDKHLRVMYNPARVAEEQKVRTAADSAAFLNRRIERMKHENFGFKEVKILQGNIGYLDLRAFMDPEYAGETAVAAMNLLSNTDAIIIDLRQNGGGSPKMIQLITSYLYGSEPVHLNNFYWRPTDTHTQTWTLPHISGNRNPNAAVYVLTSNRTFSAAEEFSYNLKNLERATLIGETTGGGAHPGGVVNAAEGFMVWVPSGRAINPITKTNWEGTGVVPHIKVKADQALKIAQVKALESLLEKTKNPQLKFAYEWSLSALKASLDPITISSSVLKTYVGIYGERKVALENGKLYYQRGSGARHKLSPIAGDTFIVDGIPYFRVQFLSENNTITAIKGRYDNGRTDKNLKTK